MDNISDKIRNIIEVRNLNKTRFCEQIGVARDYVYKLSDETIKVSTLKRICDVLEIQVVDFFIEKQKKNTLVEDPVMPYGNESEMIKALKNTIKSQEITIKSQEITINLLQKETFKKINNKK